MPPVAQLPRVCASLPQPNCGVRARSASTVRCSCLWKPRASEMYMWISICFIWVSFGSMIQKRLPFIGSIHLCFIWVSKKGFYNCASSHSAGKSMKPLPHRQHLHGGCISGGTCSVAERFICWTKCGGEGAFTCEAGVYNGFGIQ